MGNDLTIRNSSANAPKEIKSSAHYSYVPIGITLDGSKFALQELLVEGQCLVMDNVTKKYEKYADGAASPAILNGQNAITIATQAGLAADTKVEIRHNGQVFTITNAQLKTITGTSVQADVLNLARNAANTTGTLLDHVANVQAVANKLQIATDEVGSGEELTWVVVNTVAADKTSVESLFGMNTGTTDKGTGAFPEGKSKPVILDESIKFRLNDLGANPDVTVGQALVHGAIWEAQLINCTAAFKAAMPQMRFD